MNRPQQQTGMADLEAACRSLAAKYSWDEIVEKMLAEFAKTIRACKNKTLSLAEVEGLAERQVNADFAILQELQAGNYYRYKVGPNIYNKQMSRLVSACLKFKRELQIREADQSPQAKLAEAQLSARQAWGVNPDPEFADFPKTLGLVKQDSSARLLNYATDIGLETQQHEPERAADIRPGLDDIVHMLAHNGANPSEIANPPAYIREALTEGPRQWVEREAWEESLIGEDARGVFDVPQDADEARNAARKVESDEITKIDLRRLMAELKLPPDLERVLDAKINGLDLQSSAAAESLGWNPARLDRARRSLESDRPWGKALRDHFAAYNPTPKPRK